MLVIRADQENCPYSLETKSVLQELLAPTFWKIGHIPDIAFSTN